MKPMSFGYVAPRSMEALHAAMSSYGEDAKPLAGGQSLGPLLNLRLARPEVLVDLRRVAELGIGPVADGDAVRIGAMVRQRDAERSEVVREACPLLAEALPYVAHRTIRNQGTVGGSLAHADPAAEIPTVAVALDAQVVVGSVRGNRTLLAEDFVQGFFTTELEPDEVVCEIRIPRPARSAGSAWEEFAPRHGDFAIVGVAAMLELAESGQVTRVNVICSGVADRPWRAAAAESIVLGAAPDKELFRQAGAAAATGCSPSSDLVGTSDYRRHLVAVLVARTLSRAAERAGSE
jgi:aerobic carbon-monoxide dehydrogenase medium subunit